MIGDKMNISSDNDFKDILELDVDKVDIFYQLFTLNNLGDHLDIHEETRELFETFNHYAPTISELKSYIKSRIVENDSIYQTQRDFFDNNTTRFRLVNILEEAYRVTIPHEYRRSTDYRSVLYIHSRIVTLLHNLMKIVESNYVFSHAQAEFFRMREELKVILNDYNTTSISPIKVGNYRIVMEMLRNVLTNSIESMAFYHPYEYMTDQFKLTLSNNFRNVFSEIANVDKNLNSINAKFCKCIYSFLSHINKIAKIKKWTDVNHSVKKILLNLDSYEVNRLKECLDQNDKEKILIEISSIISMNTNDEDCSDLIGWQSYFDHFIVKTTLSEGDRDLYLKWQRIFIEKNYLPQSLRQIDHYCETCNYGPNVKVSPSFIKMIHPNSTDMDVYYKFSRTNLETKNFKKVRNCDNLMAVYFNLLEEKGIDKRSLYSVSEIDEFALSSVKREDIDVFFRGVVLDYLNHSGEPKTDSMFMIRDMYAGTDIAVALKVLDGMLDFINRLNEDYIFLAPSYKAFVSELNHSIAKIGSIPFSVAVSDKSMYEEVVKNAQYMAVAELFDIFNHSKVWICEYIGRQYWEESMGKLNRLSDVLRGEHKIFDHKPSHIGEYMRLNINPNGFM